MTNDELKKQFQGFTNRIDAMSLRERALIFITILVALYFLAVNALFGPLNIERDRLQKQLDQKRQETQALEMQVQAIAATGSEDHESTKRKKLQALQENLKTTDTELVRITTGLVPPREMARLMEQMLLKNRGLQVIRVESIPASPLQEGAGGTAQVYKHGMQVEVKGGYLDVLRYLKSLEALPWKVFWGKVALKTEKYPNSRVSLVIYTLSTNEAWIGL